MHLKIIKKKILVDYSDNDMKRVWISAEKKLNTIWNGARLREYSEYIMTFWMTLSTM